MSIVYKTGDILEDDADYIVVPVNTKGAMGAGLAKQAAKAFPHLKKEHRKLCLQNKVNIGKMIGLNGDRWFVLFPTKDDWRNPSKIEYIDMGLQYMRRLALSPDISFAFPKLGCGLGGLDWNSEVKPLMESYLSDVPYEVRIYVNSSEMPA